HRRRRHRVDAGRDAEQPLDGDDEPLLEAAGIREPEPPLQIATELLVARPAASTASARPVVVDDHVLARLEQTLRPRREDAAADLVAGDVRQRQRRAERHLAARRLDVAEADTARQHLDQRRARAQLGLRHVDLDERVAVPDDRHRLHGDGCGFALPPACASGMTTVTARETPSAALTYRCGSEDGNCMLSPGSSRYSSKPTWIRNAPSSTSSISIPGWR